MSDARADELLWLIGAGPMAREYARVLSALGKEFSVIGRSEASAAAFEESVGVPVQRGGLLSALSESSPPGVAIVAVGIDQLATTASALVEAGTQRVLVEKPAGLNSGEIRALLMTADQMGADVLVAYNRRFFSSVAAARRMIEDDGGVTSCLFEVTEHAGKIAKLDKPHEVKAVWFLANTSHVVDLVISLCGLPVELSTQSGGSLSWHPVASRFTGSGLTESGVTFSYHGDWEAPGRWGVEVCTRERRLVFRPMEELHMIVRGSETMERVDIDDRLDREFKPGLYRLTKAFLARDDRLLCHIREHVDNCRIYDRMAGYEGSVEPTGDHRGQPAEIGIPERG